MQNKKQYKQRTNTIYDRVQRAKYGQNYIKDPSLVRRLLDMTTVNNEDTVLEIGPGQGVFTAEILERAGQLVSIEIDEGNVQYLKDMYKDEIKAKQLEIVHKDALLFEHRWAQTNIVDNHYKIVASIPYSISSELFKKFLLKKPMPSETWFTVQKEFAQRVLGGFAHGSDGLLSVMILSFYNGKIVHKFVRENFSPIPGVDSVFLELTARTDIPEFVTMNFGAYKDMVRDGYRQPIKTVHKFFSEKVHTNKLQQLADKHKFKLKELTTELSAQQWQAIFVASVS
jgi:16S rRNA A1518/A1519 N6-dimethyltransferase RsmA/KsgA/DIM1 with predicted DNA glycosylase/AP lyase activity